MKNKFWHYMAISAAGLLLSMPAEARQLSPDQALTRVQKNDLSADGMRKVRSAARPKLVKTTLTERQSLPAFYVFENAEGLLIASADDRLPAVLGYAENGSFSDIPANMEWWLSQYEEEIGAYYDSAAEDAPQWVSTYDQYDSWAPLETLCKTEWNQTSPYNDQCPMLNGSRTVTGCVATALAQVIRYKGYLNCRGKKSYQWAAGNQTLSFDYDKYKVDFSLLRDAYTGGATQAQRDEVAKLMLAVGIAVSSNYNSATGATFNDGIRDYLGYGDYFTFERAGLSSQEWEKACYDLIKAGHPLAYGGSGTGGHAFVCDGYSENGLFHFNWGWGGLSNGYFRLSALNPRDQGTGSFEGGYTMGQNITVLLGDNDEKFDYYNAVRPGTVIWDTAAPINLAGCSNSPSQNICTLNLGLQYALTKAISYMENVGIGLVLYNRDGQGDNVYIAPSSYNAMTVQQTVLKSASVKFKRDLLTPGATYDAYPVYTFKNHDGYWRLSTYGSAPVMDHWLISVADDYKISCSPETSVNLGLNAYDMETNDLYIGDNANTFKCLLVNSSPEDINETISLRLYQQTKDDQYDQVKEIATSYMLLASGESMKLEAKFSLSDLKEPGNYAFKLFNNSRNKLLGAPSELFVTINDGKRPEDEIKKPQLSNSYQIALWIDGKMHEMAPQTILSGNELKLSTAIIAASSVDANYSLAIFKHGETYSPIVKYPVTAESVKGDGSWHQSATVEIKPELPLGVYTMAFIDQYEGLVSYPTDLYINAEVDGVRYTFDTALAGLSVCGHNGALAGSLEIPAEVDGIPVKAIADGIFDRDKSLTSIILPAGIEHIGVNSFRAASALKAVMLDGKQVPFANVAIPFGSINPGTEFYVDSEAYPAYLPAFTYRGHARLYAAVSNIKLPSEASTDLSKDLDLDFEVSPAEHINPNFTVEVANPSILSAEIKDGKLHISPKTIGETDVDIIAAQPDGRKASVRVSVKDDTISLTEISAEKPSETFDLLGRKISSDTRGLQIKNGKIILKK